MIRAFLAIELPEALRSALAVQQFLLPLPRKEPLEKLHLTLVFLGDCPPDALEALHDGLQALRAAPFDLAIEGLGLFGGARPRAAYAAVLPSDPLMRLQARCETLARRAGCPAEARNYLPHVTLGRFAPPPPEVRFRLERAIAEAGAVRAGPSLVDEITLYRSTLRPQGSRYDVLARYPLR